jgi:hypothetical protein
MHGCAVGMKTNRNIPWNICWHKVTKTAPMTSCSATTIRPAILLCSKLHVEAIKPDKLRRAVSHCNYFQRN